MEKTREINWRMENFFESKDTFNRFLSIMIRIPTFKSKNYGLKRLTSTNEIPFNCTEWKKDGIGHLKSSYNLLSKSN